MKRRVHSKVRNVMECKAKNVTRRVLSAKCRVQGVECGARGVQSVECEV